MPLIAVPIQVPTCLTCNQEMRLIGIEVVAQGDREELVTFECSACLDLQTRHLAPQANA